MTPVLAIFVLTASKLSVSLRLLPFPSNTNAYDLPAQEEGMRMV